MTGVKGGQDIRRNVELIFSTGRKESLLGAEIEEGEGGRMLHLIRESILLFRALRWAVLSRPLLIARGVFLQPKEKVTVDNEYISIARGGKVETNRFSGQPSTNRSHSSKSLRPTVRFNWVGEKRKRSGNAYPVEEGVFD